MIVHLRKLCVGADSVADLDQWQKARAAANVRAGLGEIVWHTTRSYPKRAEEILGQGGSLYWIIRGVMVVRQPILRLDQVVDEEGRPACNLVFEPSLIPVEPRPHRPFQGWRYLEAADAPPDLGQGVGADGLPADLAAELRALGAW
jgi:hypothetical protein